MFRFNARSILHRHVPAGKCHHATTVVHMKVVKRCFFCVQRVSSLSRSTTSRPIPLPIPDPSVAEPERLAALSGFKIFLIYLCIPERWPCRDCGFPLRWAYCCATFQSAHTREYIYLRVFGRCSFGAAITGSNFQLTISPHSCIELHNAISKLEPAQDDQKGEITNKG